MISDTVAASDVRYRRHPSSQIHRKEQLRSVLSPGGGRVFDRSKRESRKEGKEPTRMHHRRHRDDGSMTRGFVTVSRRFSKICNKNGGAPAMPPHPTEIDMGRLPLITADGGPEPARVVFGARKQDRKPDRMI